MDLILKLNTNDLTLVDLILLGFACMPGGTIVNQASGVVSLVMSVTPISYLPFGVAQKLRSWKMLCVSTQAGPQATASVLKWSGLHGQTSSH